MTYQLSRDSGNGYCYFSLYKHKNANISDPACERPSSHVNSSSYLIFQDFKKKTLKTAAHKRNYSITSSINSQEALVSGLKKPKFTTSYDDTVVQDEMYHHPSLKKPSWTWNNLYINTEISKRRPEQSNQRREIKNVDNCESYSDKSGYTTPTTKSDFSEFKIYNTLENEPMIKLSSFKHADITDNTTTEDNGFFSDDSFVISADGSDGSSLSYPHTLDGLKDRSPYLITLKDLATKTKTRYE